MGNLILSDVERQFIHDNRQNDVHELMLHPPASIDKARLPVLLTQIKARQKARHKLPTWWANAELIFPLPLSVEQASSEVTATYKASLLSGTLLADLTGGMGVDAVAFARQMEQVIYVERHADLAQVAAYNFNYFGLPNISIQVADGLNWLANQPLPVDWVYLDPARRDGQGKRVVGLADCEPDVLSHLPAIQQKAANILLKTSPLLDIEQTIRQLGAVRAVYVVGVHGEVKELLFILGQTVQPLDAVMMSAVNLTDVGHHAFTYKRSDELRAPVMLSDPLTYLYEPNASLLKAGAFRLAGHRFGLAKLAPHSHLYTSHELVADFPGRVFRVEGICRADHKAVLRYVPGGQANLTVRNFPETVAVLRQKLKLREGGDVYIFATTLQNCDKRLLITYKVTQEP